MIITLDFETYFDKDYSLSKMTCESYVRDKRFEPHGVAVRAPGGETAWIPPLNLKTFFDSVDWSQALILHHHAQFDGLILSHYYRVRPRAWLDSLSMARLVLGAHRSNSLDALAKHYGLPAKSVPYDAFRGLHWDELSGVVQEQLAEGGQHDVLLTYECFTRLFPYVPNEELRLIDLTIRMFVEPVLLGDIDAFKAVELGEIIRKQTLREQLNVTDAELQSSEKFAELLRACGIEPPMKQTPAGQAYAFARTDKFMTEVILEHPDDRVRTLGEARLRTRSTIEQTRAQRLAGMAGRGAMPVYLQYAGAHTTRWSGGDKLNWQNFKRGSGLRKAIHAPAGYQIVKVDKSQIECRFLNYLAGQWDVVERFRRKEDPYIGIASMAYGERVYKAKENDPRYSEMLAKRGTGKQLELSCGYGAGTQTIQTTAAKGTYGPPVAISLAQADQWKRLYRSTHPRVVEFWYKAEETIYAMSRGLDYNWSIFKTRGTDLYLPNGTCLHYPNLRQIDEGPDKPYWWAYESRYGLKKIWGGFLVENVIQAVSRVDIGQCWLRLADMGYRVVLMEHDALGIVVRNETAEHDCDVILAEMKRAPIWLPEIPLDAEATMGESYA